MQISAKQQQKFVKFVKLMYPAQKKAIKLLNYIFEHCQNIENDFTLDFETAYHFVFGGKIIHNRNRKNLLNTLSDLTKWIENFFICEWKTTPSFHRNLYLADIWAEKGLFEEKEKTLNYTKGNISKKAENYWTTLNKFIINESLYFNTPKDQHQLQATQLKKNISYLDQFYFLNKLKYACELRNRAIVLNETYENILDQQIIAVIKKKYIDTPAIHGYYLYLQLISTESLNAYEDFKQMIFNYKGKDRTLQLTFLIYAANFAAKKIRIGENNFAEETLNLYIFGIEQKLMVASGYFHEMSFKNIVNLFCFFGQPEKAKLFVDSWKKDLPKASKSDLSSLSYARILMYNQSFKDCISILKQSQFSNSFYEVEARVLKIRCLYECSYFDKSELDCLALESFLRRNKQISASLKKGGLQFAQIMKKIINQRNKHAITKALAKANLALYSNWLRQKIDALPS